MTKLSASTIVFFLTLSALADPAPPSPTSYIPVTEGGMRQGQENLKKQNAITEDVRSDEKFGIRTLQQQANDATSAVTPQQKTDLYNLGAELLPFVTPYINEIAKSCIDKIDFQLPFSEIKVGNCAKDAVGQFQKNPAAFIDRLPASEKQRLEVLVNIRTQQSIRPVNKPGTMQP